MVSDWRILKDVEGAVVTKLCTVQELSGATEKNNQIVFQDILCPIWDLNPGSP